MVVAGILTALQMSQWNENRLAPRVPTVITSDCTANDAAINTT
jgi:hypothetical protein